VGTIPDALWPAGILLLAASAWARPRRRIEADLRGRPLLAAPAVCGLIGLGIFGYDHFHRLNLLASSLAGATILAVIARMALTFGRTAASSP
jgi:hypothetical protein